MPLGLMDMSPEVFLNIVRHLDQEGMLNLFRTSTRLAQLVGPILYNSVAVGMLRLDGYFVVLQITNQTMHGLKNAAARYWPGIQRFIHKDSDLIRMSPNVYGVLGRPLLAVSLELLAMTADFDTYGINQLLNFPRMLRLRTLLITATEHGIQIPIFTLKRLLELPALRNLSFRDVQVVATGDLARLREWAPQLQSLRIGISSGSVHGTAFTSHGLVKAFTGDAGASPSKIRELLVHMVPSLYVIDQDPEPMSGHLTGSFADLPELRTLGVHLWWITCGRACCTNKIGDPHALRSDTLRELHLQLPTTMLGYDPYIAFVANLVKRIVAWAPTNTPALRKIVLWVRTFQYQVSELLVLPTTPTEFNVWFSIMQGTLEGELHSGFGVGAMEVLVRGTMEMREVSWPGEDVEIERFRVQGGYWVDDSDSWA